MPTRFLAAVGYGGADVRVEIDVYRVVEQEPSDTSPTGWRYPDGGFAPEPDLGIIRDQAEAAKHDVANQMRSPELAKSVRSAEISIERGEEVESPPGPEQSTFRVDPKDGQGWREYDL